MSTSSSSSSSSSSPFDIHQEITNRIVASIETAGAFHLPWIRSKGGSFALPVNVASRKAYNGVNIVSLWVSAIASEFPSHIWGTYRQWQERGAQVRKGEKASLIVFYKTVTGGDRDGDDHGHGHGHGRHGHGRHGDGRHGADHDHEDAGRRGERSFARASWVFNAAQVDGYRLEDTGADVPDVVSFDPIARAEALALSSGAVIVEGGDMACYEPLADRVLMPERRRFVGTATTTPAEGFYSTLFHELTHWTGAKQRLARDLSGRFGSAAYAVEELVAELGAAFLCAEIGLTQEPRADHAAYVANWLRVLKSDKKAVFTAASKASEAVRFLLPDRG